jgi:hypothetical protein
MLLVLLYFGGVCCNGESARSTHPQKITTRRQAAAISRAMIRKLLRVITSRCGSTARESVFKVGINCGVALDFLAAAIKRSISAVVRYSRVRTEEFKWLVPIGRPCVFPRYFARVSNQLAN